MDKKKYDLWKNSEVLTAVDQRKKNVMIYDTISRWTSIVEPIDRELRRIEHKLKPNFISKKQIKESIDLLNDKVVKKAPVRFMDHSKLKKAEKKIPVKKPDVTKKIYKFPVGASVVDTYASIISMINHVGCNKTIPAILHSLGHVKRNSYGVKNRQYILSTIYNVSD